MHWLERVIVRADEDLPDGGLRLGELTEASDGASEVLHRHGGVTVGGKNVCTRNDARGGAPGSGTSTARRRPHSSTAPLHAH